MHEPKFVVEKVLNTKEQDGTKMVLVQWKNYSIEQSTWEPASKFQHIDILIEEYQKSKAKDLQKNHALKFSENIACGQNPYQQTQRHGHFMYGDEPQSIENIKVFKNPEGSEELVTVVCEIKWENREELDQEKNSIYVILENSFIDTKTISEFRPDFLANFYEKRIRLNYQANEIPQK